MMIVEFKKEYRFLSNMYKCKVILNDVTYPSAEHAYMSGKNDSEEWINKCSDKNISGLLIKRLSKSIDLKNDWEDIKLEHMRKVIYAKFYQNANLSKKLIDTGELPIYEGNTWNDTFWGVNIKTLKGDNNLGRILEETRNKLIRGY